MKDIKLKKCPKCNKEKPSTEKYFYKQKVHTKKMGTYYTLSSWCVDCPREKQRKYKENNKDEINKKNYAYFLDHKDRIYYLRNKWMEENKSQQKEYQSIWRRTNKDKIYIYGKEKRMHGTHDITDEEWYACLDYFSNSCAYCGLSEQEQLNTYNHQFHREHVDHEGSNYIENCIPACTKCNTSKHDSEFNDWYNEGNRVFSKKRLNKIISWMTKDCFKILNLQ